MKKYQVTLTDREHSAVIAVLRAAESIGLARMAQMVPGIDDIANNAGQLQPLTQEELGDLADRVNEEAVELTESGKPREPDVMSPWKQRINEAFLALGDAKIVFSPVMFPADSTDPDYEARRGQVVRIVWVGSDITKEPDYDEESLPYFRVEFDDSGELDAKEEELFSHDPRFLELLSAVTGGFAAARDLGFMGPRHLADEGELNHKDEFLVAMRAFNLTECAQHEWTPAEFRAQDRGTHVALPSAAGQKQALAERPSAIAEANASCKQEFTVVGFYSSNAQIFAHQVMAEGPFHAFAEVAGQHSDAEFICALPGAQDESVHVFYPGEGVVCAETVLSQPEVFGQSTTASQDDDCSPGM